MAKKKERTMRALIKLGSIISILLTTAVGMSPVVRAQDSAVPAGVGQPAAAAPAKDLSLVEKVEALTAKMSQFGKDDKPFRMAPPRIEQKEATGVFPAAPAAASTGSTNFTVASLARQKSLAQYIQSTFAVPEAKARTIVSAAFKNAREKNIHPELILAVIAVESSFKETAKNGGAMGLMQIIPRWHKQKIAKIGGTRQLFDPAKNIRVGTSIFKDYLESSSGNIRNALIRYNGSLSARAYASKILTHYRRMLQVSGQE
jgi:soluble lytic murein transglycosylase-like protein